MKSVFTIAVIGVLSIPFLTGSLVNPGHPLARKEVTEFDTFIQKTFEYSETIEPSSIDLMESIPKYVQTPEGGISWSVFNETKEHEFSYQQDDEYDYIGVRPEFSEEMKQLEGSEILIQGYMFPLGQEEEQSMYLLGPFPLSCPYHYHVPPKLIIEVHAKSPEKFSYDTVNVRGTLELVPQDDEYNVFYRLRDAEIVP